MEDPLRPKAVPLAAETVLWFEFLLDPQLITKHLKKVNPEPSAIDLMAQFISMTPDTVVGQYDATTPDVDSAPNGIPITPGTSGPSLNVAPNPAASEGLRISRKQLALKILALKVATWLKWNLDLLEKVLPIPKQIFLLRDLCTVSFGKLVSVPLAADFQPKVSSVGNENAARFALTFYHRWVLRLQILRDIALKSARPSMSNMFVPMEPMHQFFAPDIAPQPSIDYLQELCKSNDPFYVFTYDTFVSLHPSAPDATQQNYNSMKQVSLSELRTQIYFDLVNFYLYTKQYQLAREAVLECRANLEATKTEYQADRQTNKDFIFCHVNEDELEGYLLACGVSAQKITLMERFNLSQLSEYKDIVEILKLDNRAREIPLVNRRILELDIEGSISLNVIKEPRTLEMQVAALNVIRSIFEENNIFGNVDYFEKYRQQNCFAPFVEGLADILPHCSLSERNAIKKFLVECILKNANNSKQIVDQVMTLDLFTKEELEDLNRQTKEEELFVPPLALQSEWRFNSKHPRIDIGSLERQLIACNNANTVRKLLVKLAATNPTKPLWTVNPSWEIATPIKSLIMSMQRGFLQDFSYVLLGKAREMTAKNDYVGAVSMLSVLKSETQRQELSNASTVSKLGKLVNWEILLIQITQCLEEWNHKTLDLQSLGNRCKQCLGALQNGDTVIPRIEIVESCAMMLLNLNDWNALMFLDKRLPQLELPIAFAATFLDMEKMKGAKKIYRDAWDIILSMFVNTSKRSGGGQGNSRNSPNIAVSTGLHPFLKRIRHQILFSLTISLLGKIHNILKDDPNHDLIGEYMQLWPTSISNPIGYNIRSVSETLNWLLKEALTYYPQTIAWLKMKGDLELAIGNNEAAMRCYVNALITGTDYCTIPLQRNVADDYVIRKMIRCSSNLGCHMQATILCQFLEEIDYAIVFKNLTEKSSNFADAMDAYYNCIWDTTLLEFIINLHAKKGEHTRKLDAIAIMGNLELNANNNDEIKRLAAAIRKTRFLRALAKQYLL